MTNAGTSAFDVDRRLLRQCVHCGLCLSYCPTYQATGSELDSPRGRIWQIRAAVEGRIDPADPRLFLHVGLCLGCRACETACPSGVEYGRILEAARAHPSQRLPAGTGAEVRLRRLILGWLFTSNGLLDLAGLLVRTYDRGGLRPLAHRAGLLQLLPKRLQAMERLLPTVQGGIAKVRLPGRAPAVGERRARVAFLAGCIQSQLFGETNAATVRVLARNGCEVVTPPAQVCCGALHAHVGEREAARALARRNLAAFGSLGAEAVIVNAAGCGSTLKEYGELLRGDPEYAERAAAFSAKVRDIAEFLADLGLRPPSHPVPRRVTYADPCHLAHGQRVRDQPRQLLQSIPGLDFVEMSQADWCCGSAGIYNLLHPDMAEQVLAWKVDNILATGAEIVATGNPGCLIQLAHGLRARHPRVRAVHPVDLLDEAYGRVGSRQ